MTTSPASGALPASATTLTAEKINELRQRHGVTSNGRGIREFEQVASFAREVATLASREASPAPLTDEQVRELFRASDSLSDPMRHRTPWQVWRDAFAAFAALASPQVAPAPEPVSWQGRRVYEDEPVWGRWSDLHPDNVAMWKEKAVKKPDMFQLRALYLAAPVQVAPAPGLSKLTDEQILSTWKHVSVWGWATDEDRIARAKELIALAALAPVAPTPAQPSEDARDAARYRWLRDQHWVEPEATFRLDLTDSADAEQYRRELAAAIDQRLSPLPSEPEGERA